MRWLNVANICMAITLTVVVVYSCKKVDIGTDKIKIAQLILQAPGPVALAGPEMFCDVDQDLSAPYFTYGFCYDTIRRPMIPGQAVAASNYASGRFSAFLPALTFGRKYFVRAFVTNGSLTTYSNVDSFVMPTYLTTGKVTNISARAFEIDITREAFTGPVDQLGICYGTATRPTVNGLKVFSATTNTGVTHLTISDTLKAGTLYYVRSVLVSNGVAYYGNEVSFTTAGYRGGSGGYIIYDKGDTTNGWRFLEAALDTIKRANATWGCSGSFIPGLTAGLGSGLANSETIIAGCTQGTAAAALCRNLLRNTKSDWYLPDTTELSVYQQLRLSKVITRKYRLFSSTQASAADCIILDSTGLTTVMAKSDTNAFIIPVRRF